MPTETIDTWHWSLTVMAGHDVLVSKVELSVGWYQASGTNGMTDIGATQSATVRVFNDRLQPLATVLAARDVQPRSPQRDRSEGGGSERPSTAGSACVRQRDRRA